MQTQTIELIYNKHCPNLGLARTRLLKALSGMKLLRKWKRWVSNDPDAPSYTKEYGSPTTLINYQGVIDSAPGNGGNCCIYNNADGENKRLNYNTFNASCPQTYLLILH